MNDLFVPRIFVWDMPIQWFVPDHCIHEKRWIDILPPVKYGGGSHLDSKDYSLTTSDKPVE